MVLKLTDANWSHVYSNLISEIKFRHNLFCKLEVQLPIYNKIALEHTLRVGKGTNFKNINQYNSLKIKNILSILKN
jgi:hypothetical protein